MDFCKLRISIVMYFLGRKLRFRELWELTHQHSQNSSSQIQQSSILLWIFFLCYTYLNSRKKLCCLFPLGKQSDYSDYLDFSYKCVARDLTVEFSKWAFLSSSYFQYSHSVYLGKAFLIYLLTALFERRHLTRK